MRLSALAISLLTMAAFARGADVVIGPVFDIAEPDTMEEIKQRLSKQDWEKILRKEPANYGAFQGEPLPVATQTFTRTFDPTYTLPYDIRDDNGALLVAKGTTVNVYERIQLPGRYIVVDGSTDQLKWLEEVAQPTAADRILLASGNVYSTRLRSKFTFWLLDKRGIERFGLRAVPSIVEQDGRKLRISEFAL